MKTLVKLFFILFSMSLLMGCSKTDEFFTEDSDMLKSEQIKNQTRSHGLDQDRFVVMKETGLKVHYRIIGKGPIDMVLLPGWTNPLTVYTKQFDYFRDKARCIYVDFPGQGLSDAPQPGDPLDPESTGIQYTQELLAEAVYNVIKKEGLHHFVAVGFSMGPRVWGMFERNHPGMIDKLVAIDGGFNPWPEDPAAIATRQANREATFLAQLNWDASVKQLVAASLVPPTLTGADAEELKEWVTYFYEFPSDVLANINYHYDAPDANEPLDWAYPKLCLYSNPNPNMDKVNLIYPNNTTYSFPGGGHVIHWIFNEEINPLIWDFIKDRPGKKY